MKKYYIVLLTLLLACASCRQEVLTPEGSEVIDPSRLRFELSIELPGSTKGVKSGWENGDVVFLFINGNTSGYVAASYNNPRWNTDYRGTLTIDALGASGTLSAVYLPYGYNAAASYADSKWTFDGGTDTYYLCAENVAYTVSTVDEEKILYATVSLQRAGYVQFFIPCPSASGTVQLACNALRPAGFGSLSSDGTVTDRTDGTTGSWIYGYPDTLDGEEGYYVSGIPAESPGQDYYFALHKTDDSYADYYKHRTAIAAGGAYELPAYSNWHTVNNTGYVFVAGANWRQMNAGASLPWALGSTYAWSGVTGAYDTTADQLPANSHWTDLLDGSKASRIPMHIGDGDGYLFVSASSAANYIFLPRSTASNASYWTASGGSGAYLWTPTDDATPEVRTSSAPSEAYVRSIKKGLDKNWFRIIARADGTITRDGSNTLYYSVDGGDWQTYTAAIPVTAGQEVAFKSTAKSWNSSGDNPKQYKRIRPDFPFDVAGDLSSLLVGDNFDTTGPDATGYTFVDFFNGSLAVDASQLVIPMKTIPANALKSFFDGSTLLVAGPAELPATTIAGTCYRNMFKGCSSLTSAPIIRKATNRSGSGWYQQMFTDCSSLQEIIFLDDYYYNDGNFTNWVKGVNGSGTFYKSSSMTTFPAAGNSSTPSGWTVTNYTP